jgi:hypothetical protein
LFAAVPDGTKMTLRMSNKILLTGGLEDVAVRPSTGLKLRETPDTVYRVLQFDADSDENGPYDLLVNTDTPTIFKVTLTITDITSDVCTTSGNHKLRIGDRIIPTSTANGFTSGITYFIKTVPAYNQFTVSTSPGGTVVTLSNGSPLTIKAVKTHKLVESYTIRFSTTGTLPAPLLAGETYFVTSTGLTETEFRVSEIKNGPQISITTAGSGTHRYNIEGLTLTNLRENYDYVDLTILNPGEFISSAPTGTTCTISIANPAVVTLNSHGFVAGDVIKFTTTGTLPTGISALSRFFVLDDAPPSANSFRISDESGGAAIETTGAQSGIQKVGLVTGRAGDDTLAVVAISTESVSRAQGSKFVWRGEEYVISTYQSESVTNQPFGRVILNRGLTDAINNTDSSYTIKSGVAVRSSGSLGTLTIRISLTRVTGHDLLEIGTGSYADTNYPSEIYGAPVNALDPADEVEERDVGRVFYVTTDQFGNFSVGPFFRVDQGTGQVTFSSSIALSNLDGIGFKRGVPVSEFSTDSGMTDNATDTVPTENATRIYIERRLGLTHVGSPVTASQLLPVTTGGYMSLDGQLGMKADMNLNFNKIFNVKDATNPQDAVNLRSLTFDNFQELVFEDTISAAEIPTFIGVGPIMINASIGGDLSASLGYNISTTLTGAYYDDSSIQEIDSGIEDESDIQVSDGIVVASYASFPDSGYIKINNEVLYYAAKVLGAGAGAPTANRLTGILRAQLGSTATSHAAGSAVYSLSNVTHNLQIVSGSIINTDVNAAAAIAQSKLDMTIATAQAAAPAGTAAVIQAASGLSSFSNLDFDVTNGHVTLKANSVLLGDLAQLAADTLIGNSGVSTANAAAVAFTTVVDEGLAVKKSQYSTVGFLRRTGAATDSDANFVVVAGSSGSSASVGANDVIVRDSNGDFGGRTIDVSNIKIDTQLSIDSSTTGSGGFLRYYGYNSAGGILIQDGSLAADKKIAYWNDSHEFKTQNGVSNAPITCSTVTATSVQAQTLTTGGNTTAGTITGRWTLSGTSPNESRMQATYAADLAENYEGDRDYEVGTVLVFGGDKEVTSTDIKNDTRVAGVVSNTAAYTMYEACPGLKNLVALQGRVPCKVVGKIRKGDILVTSGIPGVAAAAHGDVKVGTVVGKALKDYDSDHIGLLEIAVGRT